MLSDVHLRAEADCQHLACFLIGNNDALWPPTMPLARLLGEQAPSALSESKLAEKIAELSEGIGEGSGRALRCGQH